MLATFVIEFTLAFIVFVKYKLNSKTRVCFFTLICLGIFQLAEYQICRSSHGMFWAYTGFAAITLLPAMGLDLVTDKNRKIWVSFGYLLSLGMIAAIFYFGMIQTAVCGSNYVIFSMSSAATASFTVYYLGLLLLGVVIGMQNYFRARKVGGSQKTHFFFWVIVGYVSFLFPTGVVYLASSQARLGATSIMCGFAVLFAFILFFKILPALFFLKVTSPHRTRRT